MVTAESISAKKGRKPRTVKSPPTQETQATSSSSTTDVVMTEAETAPPPANPEAEPVIAVTTKPVFQIAQRKNKGKLAQPKEAFKILDPADYPPINTFDHTAPFGGHENLNNPRFPGWVSNAEKRVLVTLIGSFKNKESNFPYEKVTKLIQRTVKFLTKDAKKEKINVITMPDREFLLLETTTEETAKILTDAYLVMNHEFKAIVLFRPIQLVYNEVRSITISHMWSKLVYEKFEEGLKELEIEVDHKIYLQTAEEACLEMSDKAIWIVKPKEPVGELNDKVCPIEGSKRIVHFSETVPCKICKGEDHRSRDCQWNEYEKAETINTWWGTYPQETRQVKSKDKGKAKARDDPQASTSASASG